MESYNIEKIITLAILCVWFVFPVGMFISIWRQGHEEKTSKTPSPPPRLPEYHNFVFQNEAEDNEDEPSVPNYQIPKPAPKKDSIVNH